MTERKDKEAVTIQTIAKIANVSHTTVSRALNDSNLVKPETKRKIDRIARELGYVPNYNARRLVTHRSNIIGIFFTNLEIGTSSSFLTEVVAEAQKRLPRNYSLSLNSITLAENDPRISVQNFDGVIILSQSESDDPFIQSVIDSNIPAVILNRDVKSKRLNNFAVNDFLGSKVATEYAIRMGHRHFALIEGIDAFTSTHQRTLGFFSALKDAGILREDVIVKRGDYKPRSGNIAMRQILSSRHMPTCVITENDDMAVGAISACDEMGYRVPDDISIIGFDDMNYSKYLTPSLTTIRKPTTQVVQDGVDCLVRIIENACNTVMQKIYDPEMIVRSSVKQIRVLEKE